MCYPKSDVQLWVEVITKLLTLWMLLNSGKFVVFSDLMIIRVLEASAMRLSELPSKRREEELTEYVLNNFERQ